MNTTIVWPRRGHKQRYDVSNMPSAARQTSLLPSVGIVVEQFSSDFSYTLFRPANIASCDVNEAGLEPAIRETRL